jgi:tetratricopeptide (TPR) repeat protein
MKKTTFVALLLLSSQCAAENLQDSLARIESEWALIYYGTPKQKQGSAYLQLLDKTVTLTKQFPTDAEPLFWEAVVKATYANHQDGFSALSSIQEARDLLEKAITIKPTTMSGSAYVTLGTLYYMAPKWPISFGDDQKAQEMLKTALNINPNGIDTNYFYGDYLLTHNNPIEAEKYFEKAVSVPIRHDQLYADNQLKAEAKLALKNAKDRKISGAKNLFMSLFNSASAK